ncbi:MAG: transporter substrate-binding domain-containing protein, partial [Chthoniobacterales bacterium]
MKKHLISAALLRACIAPLSAQTSAEPLRVVVKPAEPFAFEQNGVLTGYSVDLWKKVAAEAGYSFEAAIVQ